MGHFFRRHDIYMNWSLFSITRYMNRVWFKVRGLKAARPYQNYRLIKPKSKKKKKKKKKDSIEGRHTVDGQCYIK